MSTEVETVNAEVKDGRRFSPVWLIPLAAVLFGLWILFSYLSNLGSQIEIRFQTAEGVEAGKTKIKTLNVEIGLVTEVRLNDDQKGVTVVALIDGEAKNLLAKDSKFWVVKPRLGAGGISGLGTLLSGAYIELEPGAKKQSKSEFVGLENIPATSGNTPGVHIKLESRNQNALSVGQAIRFQGMRVGQVESLDFDTGTQATNYSVFIEAPYDQLVSENTHFWKVDGVEFKTSTEGVKLSIGSIETLLSGGITFGLPPALPAGAKAKPGAAFSLHRNQKAAFEREFEHFGEYVILINDSVRGLNTGSPVEYRGIKVGEILPMEQRIEAFRLSGTGRRDVPVKLRLDPARMGFADTAEDLEKFKSSILRQLSNGLSAKVETGNLITGQKLVSLDFGSGRRSMSRHSGHVVIPSVAGGFGQITQQVSNVLAKVEALPIDQTVRNSNAALANIAQLSKRLDTLVAQSDMQNVPKNLNQTLDQARVTLDGLSPTSPAYQELNKTLGELQKTLKNLQPVLRTMNDKPNALIFGSPQKADPQPRKKED